MAGVEIHAARPKTAPSVLSQILGARNPLNAARTTVAPWLRGTEERVPSVIPGLLAGAIESSPMFAPTVGEAVGKTGEAVIGPELLAAMKMMEKDPTQRTDLMQGMLSSPIAYPMAAMTLYHGSPYQFDRFDLSKVGTGEGAQAYGHGIYFAESPGVAGKYRDALSERKGRFKPDAVLDDLAAAFPDEVLSPAQAQNVMAAVSNRMDAKAAQAQMPSLARLDPEKLQGVFDDIGTRVSGGFYTVDIPDELLEGRLLDWDAPLSEQPEAVRKALAGAVEAPDLGTPMFGAKYAGSGYHPRYESVDADLNTVIPQRVVATETYATRAEAEAAARNAWERLVQDRGNLSARSGKQLYDQLVSRLGGQQQASDYLKSLGIPGLRYFDGQSRGSGEGTRNLVIWAQDILDKAGVARK